VVVLANLAGFDGSPESMREWQLEFGAEIGRAVVNFDGPIVFCVVSRYHGGAFVVFSQTLNEQLEAVAVEGAHASVIGGAPAAAVVFARDVAQAARGDERIVALDGEIAAAEGAHRVRLREQRAALWDTVLAERRGAFAAEFDEVHSVERAVAMGSVGGIIPSSKLRPYLVAAVERGIRKTLDGPRRVTVAGWLTASAADVPPATTGSGARSARCSPACTSRSGAPIGGSGAGWRSGPSPPCCGSPRSAWRSSPPPTALPRRGWAAPGSTCPYR
jgi:hypothetical protein